ncbi:ABC-2 family transporter protein [Clostridium sp. 'deep sea']|uniref:ABC transporter permease n=1 Tax=Clostridium sp. 'deep sea' TaxID=2779445 RepID=UPI00189676BB|nr:ABC-2 family transporter protein [Clostridium sp. 'deep sea']QOR34013.1 ABC-2 family transporter protein [Clostridium sp. 'deep sea']
MIKCLKFYKKAVLASIRSAMQYKFSFLVNSFSYIFIMLSDILPVFVILYHFKSIGGWNMFHVAALWGCINISLGFTRAFCVEIHNFQEYIINGTFDNLLLRPWSTLLLLLSRKIQLFRLAGSLQGLIVLVFALLKLKVNYTTLLYLPVLIITGIVTLVAIEIIIASLAFWITRTGDILVFLFYGPTTASMYPLSIFPVAIKAFLTVWPVAYVGFKQLEYLLGFSNNASILIISPIIAVVVMTLALKLWQLGEKNYYSTGS